MHFMLLILVFLLCVVLWGFFVSNPAGASGARVLMCNVAIVVLASIVSVAVGNVLYADAIGVKADEKGMAVYLAIMAAGTAFLIVVSVGGLLRNLAIFPPSRRSRQDPQQQ